MGTTDGNVKKAKRGRLLNDDWMGTGRGPLQKLFKFQKRFHSLPSLFIYLMNHHSLHSFILLPFPFSLFPFPFLLIY